MWTVPGMDPDQAREQLGYVAPYDLAAALRDYVEWLTDAPAPRGS